MDNDSLLCHTDLSPQHILFLTQTVFDLGLKIHLVVDYLIYMNKVLGSVLLSSLYMDVCVWMYGMKTINYNSWL